MSRSRLALTASRLRFSRQAGVRTNVNAMKKMISEAFSGVRTYCGVTEFSNDWRGDRFDACQRLLGRVVAFAGFICFDTIEVRAVRLVFWLRLAGLLFLFVDPEFLVFRESACRFRNVERSGGLAAFSPGVHGQQHSREVHEIAGNRSASIAFTPDFVQLCRQKWRRAKIRTRRALN